MCFFFVTNRSRIKLNIRHFLLCFHFAHANTCTIIHDHLVALVEVWWWTKWGQEPHDFTFGTVAHICYTVSNPWLLFLHPWVSKDCGYVCISSLRMLPSVMRHLCFFNQDIELQIKERVTSCTGSDIIHNLVLIYCNQLNFHEYQIFTNFAILSQSQQIGCPNKSPRGQK